MPITLVSESFQGKKDRCQYFCFGLKYLEPLILKVLIVLFLLIGFSTVVLGVDEDCPLDSLLYKRVMELETLRYTDPASAMTKAHKIMAESLITEQRKIEALAHTSIAVILRHQGLYAQSLGHYLLAVEYFQQTADSLKTGWYYLDVGNIYFHQQLYEKARENYRRSIELNQKSGFNNPEATGYNNLALVAIKEGDTALAMDYFLNALHLREKGNDAYLLIHSYQYIGDLLFDQGKIDEATHYYQKILNIGVVDGNYNEVGNSHQSMAEIQLRLGLRDEAMEHFRMAEHNFIRKAHPRYLAQLYMKLARMYQQESNSDSSLFYLNKAYHTAFQQRLFVIEEEVLHKLIAFYNEQKEYAKAIQYYQLLIDIVQENFKSEFNKSLQSMEIKLTLTENERILAEQKNRMERQKIIRRTLMAIGAMLLVFIAYLVLNHRKKRNISALLHRQKEALLQNEMKIERQKMVEVKNELAYKQRELISKATMIQQKNDQLIALQKDIEYRIGLIKDPKEQSLLNPLLLTIASTLNHKGYWKEFKTHFVQVFPGCLEMLSKQFPKLTSGDLKFCAYLKMNLNTKDLALLTGLSVRSVESRKYRLRQKLNLTSDTNLISFLNALG